MFLPTVSTGCFPVGTKDSALVLIIFSIQCYRFNISTSWKHQLALMFLLHIHNPSPPRHKTLASTLCATICCPCTPVNHTCLMSSLPSSSDLAQMLSSLSFKGWKLLPCLLAPVVACFNRNSYHASVVGCFLACCSRNSCLVGTSLLTFISSCLLSCLQYYI